MLGVRNEGFPVAPICVWIPDFTFFNFLDKFLSSALPLLLTTSLSLTPSLRVEADDPVVFIIEVSGAAILLKPQMKR